jgi:8-oxo-dGTP pyrophosphatase MutT (NUDIX family)
VAPSLRLHGIGRALAATSSAERDEPAGLAAAVAAIVREHHGGLELLFIRRAERDGDPWSGHMAFPGGRRDASDATLLATAIRETHEEIGVDLVRSAELVGTLDDQDASGRGSKGSLIIRPFVFVAHAPIEPTLNHEVTELVWASVDDLRGEHRRTSVSIDYAGQPYTLPGWDLDGRVVWGLTYRMTRLLLKALET